MLRDYSKDVRTEFVRSAVYIFVLGGAACGWISVGLVLFRMLK